MSRWRPGWYSKAPETEALTVLLCDPVSGPDVDLAVSLSSWQACRQGSICKAGSHFGLGLISLRSFMLRNAIRLKPVYRTCEPASSLPSTPHLIYNRPAGQSAGYGVFLNGY